VRRTSIDCGWQPASTRKVRDPDDDTRSANVIASAAAVASSRSEALAIGRPVRSQIIVWKLTSASMRPWLISAW